MIYENDFKQMAYYLARIIEGNDYLYEEACALLQKYDFIDEDGYWKDDE